MLDAAAAASDGDWAGAAAEVFDACVTVIPYAPATAFQGREKDKLAARDGDPPRVALIADGIGATHGVTRTLEELRERGVPGFEVEVIGTDAHVDRRLPSVAEAEVPYYAGLKVGVPSLPAVVEALVGGPLRPAAPVHARPGRDRRGADGPAARAADRRLVPHGAGRLRRRCARATRS